MKIIQEPDARLRIIAAPVVEFDEALWHQVNGMLAIMRQHNGIGLSGTQVDYHFQVVVAQVKKDHLPTILVNPKIVATFASEGAQEGCLSVKMGRKRVFKTRARTITVEYQDVFGEHKVLKAKGVLARVIQHELQHLQGILITD